MFVIAIVARRRRLEALKPGLTYPFRRDDMFHGAKIVLNIPGICILPRENDWSVPVPTIGKRAARNGQGAVLEKRVSQEPVIQIGIRKVRMDFEPDSAYASA